MDEYQDVIAEDDILNIAIYHPKRRDVMDAIQFINEGVGFRVSQGKVDLPDIPPIEVAGLDPRRGPPGDSRIAIGSTSKISKFFSITAIAYPAKWS